MDWGNLFMLGASAAIAAGLDWLRERGRWSRQNAASRRDWERGREGRRQEALRAASAFASAAENYWRVRLALLSHRMGGEAIFSGGPWPETPSREDLQQSATDKFLKVRESYGQARSALDAVAVGGNERTRQAVRECRDAVDAAEKATRGSTESWSSIQPQLGEVERTRSALTDAVNTLLDGR